MKSKSESQHAKPEGEAARGLLPRRRALHVTVLIAVVFLVYSNAWPNSLVLDDKLFADWQRMSDAAAIRHYFVDHAWAARTLESGLYRPMLFASVYVDARLLADWFAGYHLTNILYHALVVVLLYGFLITVLVSDERGVNSARHAAFLAALVFAVHPMHTEVVNSVFNRSILLAAIGCLAGLWWLLRYLPSCPRRAWSGLFVAYVFALYSRETAIVLPGLAVVLVWANSSGSTGNRLRKVWPAFLLLVPATVYLAMRAHALSGGELAPPDIAAGHSGIAAQIDPARILEAKSVLDAAGTLAQALGLLVWPVDHRLLYPNLPLAVQWGGAILHVGLILLGWGLYRRGHKALLVGLLFFYVAFLPASRLFGIGQHEPHLQERYLYIPSIGIAVVLACALDDLRRRFDPLLAAAPAILVLLLTAPITWARNVDWADEITLFEADYKAGSRSAHLLRLITAAHLRANNFERVIEICDANPDWRREVGLLGVHCASALSYSGRLQEAEQAYLDATVSEGARALAHSNLAQHYMRQGRQEDARIQFSKAIEAEEAPALKAFRTGYMLVHLYPNDRDKLVEARANFREALRHEPEWVQAQSWASQLDAALGPDPDK